LKTDTQTFAKQYNECRSLGSNDIPIIAFKFSTYKNANKGYDLVMDDLDKLHESSQATMMVDAPRRLPSSDSNISAPHYGPFFLADIIAERYLGAAGRRVSDDKNKKRHVRVFCRKDLSLPVMDSSLIENNRFDTDAELVVFDKDRRLKDLLKRIIDNTVDDSDWLHNRPSYLSRVHENIRTKEEFENLKKHIESDTAEDYLNDKKEMSNIVSSHLKDRLPG
jgi:hypothetical protein